MVDKSSSLRYGVPTVISYGEEEPMPKSKRGPMRKEFVSYDVMRNAGFRMAAQIYADGFIPNVLYIALRGGSDLGNPISEFFKWKLKQRRSKHRVLFAAVAARTSKDNIGEFEEVCVEGWTYHPRHLRKGDKILLVDDVFDHGRTINKLVRIIMKMGIPREDIKIAVYDYKRRLFERPLPIQPDYWYRIHDLHKPEDDTWIHYLSHELVGATETEMRENIFPNDPDLAHILFAARRNKLKPRAKKKPART